MSLDSTGPTTPRRSDAAKVFRVEHTGLGWAIYLVGDRKAYGSSSQQLATAQAQKLARQNRPSVVVVEADGSVIQGWEFPVEDQSVA